MWFVMGMNYQHFGNIVNGKIVEDARSEMMGYFTSEEEAVEAILEDGEHFAEGGINKLLVAYPLAVNSVQPFCMDMERERWFEFDNERWQKSLDAGERPEEHYSEIERKLHPQIIFDLS